MSSYNNFQRGSKKNTKDRNDIYNPDFISPVEVKNQDFIDRHLDKWLEFISFLKFYPDYFYDLIKPKTGQQFNFDLDQRVMIRALVRFPYNYDCIPRGGSKTLIHIMASYHICIFHPNISVSVLASTKQSAVDIWEDKHNEILTFFPYIGDCIKEQSFTKDKARVEFVNGAWVDNLANSQQSKGKRRRRGGIEEDNLVDKATFEDAIAPIFNVPRKTIAGIEDYEELNGQLNRFTTSGYKNSDAYETIMQHFRDMVDLKGSFVYTSDWCIPVHFGRQKMSVVNKAREGRITAYKMNYLCEWVGNGEGSLINVSLLMKARVIKFPEFECEKDKRGKLAQVEYVMAIDVARSTSSSNNKSAIVIKKIIRGSNGKVRQVHIVNIITPPNGLNYYQQATIVKKIFYKYGGDMDINKSRVRAIVVDANIIGQGLVEELLKETTDPETGDELGCFNTINTDERAQNPNAPTMIFALKSQGINGAIITNFIDYVESNRLKLVGDFKEIQDEIKQENREEYESVSMQMQYLIDEVANLKMKSIKNDTDITVEQTVRRIDKDRYAATAYGLYYIEQYMNFDEEPEDEDEECVYY